MRTSIGFLGFGEVGHALATGHRSADPDAVLVAHDAAPPGEDAHDLVARRAREANVSLLPRLVDVIEQADVVFSAVPADVTLDVAERVVPALRAGQGYYDLTAAHPDVKRRMGELVAARCAGASFADCAIIGPVRVLGHRVPIIASGHIPSGHLELLTSLGMRIDLVSAIPGDASATKLCRSVFTKGIEALLVEMMLVARKYGVADRVLASVADTLGRQPFAEAANRYITGNAVHAGRRVHELEDVIRLLRGAGIRPLATAGSLERMRAAAASGARERFHGVPPDHYQDVIELYAATEQERA